MPRFKSINFYQNRPKFKLVLPKNTKFLSVGGYVPQNGPYLRQTGACPKTPNFRRMGALPQDPNGLRRLEAPAAGGSTPTPPEQPLPAADLWLLDGGSS